ncbi:assimilatory sulfite reductase (NADPH) flavoprotein subunit [Silanimonas sp.]|uniref:assimilatory sulfite reductase (NADPH) flavoprotein subunit n=1 Tax=Silanimonas sp. TaxID=1929290 RepID=UPI0022C5A86C|nr:assimilatory sulfite reductase (NADPH) flavoprotein subunit [Silanimonas sp.]MCZ8114249.1 assimilatory sulfite reductase (NADPH) flavoprotein subunit [Silanimonas sp.]
MSLPLSSPSPASPLPLDAERRALLQRLTEGLDPATLWWVSGYLAGLATPQARAADGVLAGATALPGLPAAFAPATTEVDTLTIVYGSQTGNAKRAAEALLAESGTRGLKARLLRADAYPLAELKRETQLVVVISTQGDGDPPDDARGFVEHLVGRRAPKLESLRFAVLGLGDSSYAKFCEIGRVLDARLAELGGTRLAPLGEADVDVDTVAVPWRADVLRALEALRPASKTGTPDTQGLRVALVDGGASPAVADTAATRESPVAAELLANTRLTGRGSDRDTRHLEFAIDPATLDYAPGDAAGVWPVQAPALVEAILEATGLDGDAVVDLDGNALPLRQWLGERRELTRLNRPLLKAHAERSDSARLAAALADAGESAALLQRTPLLDLLAEHPASWAADDLVRSLRPLAPRLYSIASSREAVGDELHLTVGHEVFEGRDGLRYGAASHYLATLKEGDTARLFIEHNERFRLPTDTSRDVIMIGPGTGVAPFRAFVQHRAATGASGRNWLVFGNPHFRSDFLYQVEWQKALKAGQLHRLDLAFSRDGAAKTYVQHRINEQGAELWRWLQDGAHLYVCGDATRMAKDVHATLLAIAQQHGGLDRDAAADYFTGLERTARYARDVY